MKKTHALNSFAGLGLALHNTEADVRWKDSEPG